MSVRPSRFTFSSSVESQCSSGGGGRAYLLQRRRVHVVHAKAAVNDRAMDVDREEDFAVSVGFHRTSSQSWHPTRNSRVIAVLQGLHRPAAYGVNPKVDV